MAFEKWTPPWHVKHDNGRLWNTTSPRLAAAEIAESSRSK